MWSKRTLSDSESHSSPVIVDSPFRAQPVLPAGDPVGSRVPAKSPRWRRNDSREGGWMRSEFRGGGVICWGTAGMRMVSVRMRGEASGPAGRGMAGGLGRESFPAGMTAESLRGVRSVRWREEGCGVLDWNPRGEARWKKASSNRREFRREEFRLVESSRSVSVRGVGRVSKRGGRWGGERAKAREVLSGGRERGVMGESLAGMSRRDMERVGISRRGKSLRGISRRERLRVRSRMGMSRMGMLRRGALLSGVLLSEGLLREGLLREASLMGVSFREVSLRGISLRGVPLRWSFSELSMIGVSLFDKSMIGVSLFDKSLIIPSFIDKSFIDPSLIDPSFIDPSFINPSLIDPSIVDTSLRGTSRIDCACDDDDIDANSDSCDDSIPRGDPISRTAA